MAKEDRLPPKTGKDRMGPEMIDEDPAIVSKLSQLAGMQPGAQAGGMGGMGGGEEESASLLMSGAQQLIQAAQMNPQLQEMVGQVISILQAGVQQMAGGGGMPPEVGGGKTRKRERPPGAESEQGEMGY